jgi:hypothetical protein
MGEIDLRGEEGRVLMRLFFSLRMQRERAAEQRAADAIADRVDVLLAGRLLDRVEREIDAFAA